MITTERLTKSYRKEPRTTATGLTWIVGHCRPSDIHGVEGDERSLEQTRVWLGFLQQTRQTYNTCVFQAVLGGANSLHEKVCSYSDDIHLNLYLC